MIIPRNKLTRWHPGFGLDQVPDITPEPLPEPPNVEKYSTAKDVLGMYWTMSIIATFF